MGDKPQGEQTSPPSNSSSKEEASIQQETSISNGGGGGGRRPWQLNKSVLQANRYMLDNKIACDICFEVGLPDGTIENVYAHKYQLIARSPIFEAKLTAPGSESVRIPDIEPLPFKQLLRYLYYEEVDLRTTTAMAVWYAAQKYMVLQLDKLCIEYVKKHVRADTVCQVLEQAILYDNEEIAQLCLALAAAEAEAVFETPNFVDLSHTALERVIRQEELKVAELKVFDACLRWARERCVRRGQDPGSGSSLRHFLGTIVYQIRFPLIDARDLSTTVVPTGILTDKECTTIFQWILSDESSRSKEHIQLGQFRADKRKELLDCSRFDSVSPSEKMDCRASGSHSLAFKCDHDVLFTGVGVYGSKGVPAIHEVTLSVKRANGELLARSGSVRLQTDGGDQPLRMFIPRPVSLPADEWHSVWLTVLGLPTYRGTGGRKAVTVSDDVTFTFRDTEDATNMSDVAGGQIPQIFFYLP